MTQNTWQYQGRQEHGEWGHGTAPHSTLEADTTGKDTSTSDEGYLQFVADQGDFHREVQSEIEDLLRSNGVIFESNVGVQGYAPDPRTGLPSLARIDMIVMKPGQLPIGVEIETGERPTYTKSQQVAYPQLMIGHAFSPDP